MLLDRGFHFSDGLIVGGRERPHPLEERGGAVAGMAARIVAQSFLDDSVNRPSFPPRKLVREIARFPASDGELRSGHAIKVGA